MPFFDDMLIRENYVELWRDALKKIRQEERCLYGYDKFAVIDAAPVLRFAPSPTGRLHLGNMYSALYIREAAQAIGGKVLLRIEDIDTIRCRAEFDEALISDLKWAGFSWEGEIRRQSEHMPCYQKYIDILRERELIYPCFCSRKDISAVIDEKVNAGDALTQGPEGYHYPKTCKKLSTSARQQRIDNGVKFSWRLDIEACLKWLENHRQNVSRDWYDLTRKWITLRPDLFGDVVIARKDIGVSYHLCVTLDDALQKVTLVNRGVDLFYATHIHRLLQLLFDLPLPLYDHHPLIVEAGEYSKALAKSSKSLSARSYFENQSSDALYALLCSAVKTEDVNVKK